MTKQQIRTIIRTDASARGCSRYRITADGAAHYHGTMPNTNAVGWYFAGWAAELAGQINRREVNELRTELRRAGFDVPLRYGGLGDPEKL